MLDIAGWGPEYSGAARVNKNNNTYIYICINIAGWSSLAARVAHNHEVGGSNPPPATRFFISSHRLFLLNPCF